MGRLTPADRLVAMLDKIPMGCWEFTGSTNRYGYGRMRGATGPVGAHRLAYELSHGPIPEGLFVLHDCDNPPCCNPAHLYVGTHADNMADMDRRGRRVNRQPSGERNGNAVLDEAAVVEIRRLASERTTQRAIASQYGITQAAVSSIVTRRTWSHVA